MMNLRPYQQADKPVCLALFESNMPDFFAPHEREDFEIYLDEHTEPYFVVESNEGTVVACGGYFFLDSSTAGLAWAMVRRDLHRQGIGRFLLLARLQRICQNQQVSQVKLETSQHSFGFFATIGFQLERIVENGYAPGLHRYDCILHLDDERRQNISRFIS